MTDTRNDLKVFEEQIKSWISDMNDLKWSRNTDTTDQRIMTDIVLAQYIIIWNMNETMSLLYDLILKMYQDSKK